MIYQAGCHYSHAIPVASQWVKNDLIKNYKLSPEKIQVIPWAPPTQHYKQVMSDELATVKKKYDLDSPYAFYPSITWEHKNHIRLVEALAMLRDKKGIKVPLVCSGGQTEYYGTIQNRIRELGMQDQVKFIGYLPNEEFRAIYQLAQFVVIPTLFEAASAPIFEAWEEGIPVCCSTVTSLPEQVGDAAILFDPLSVRSIAEAIHKLATEENLRVRYAAAGTRRLSNFNWDRTAKAYRALYRKVARVPLSEEDRKLLDWDWMQHPSPKGIS